MANEQKRSEQPAPQGGGKRKFVPYNKYNKACGWGFTDFQNLSHSAIMDKIGRAQIAYYCAGVETCPTTDKKHNQGMFWLTQPKTFREVRQLLYPMQVWAINLIRRSIAYCRKEGDWFSVGTLPFDFSKGRPLKSYAELSLLDSPTSTTPPTNPCSLQSRSTTVTTCSKDYHEALLKYSVFLTCGVCGQKLK